MGYTHYWYRQKEIEQKAMEKIVNDFKKVLPEMTKVGLILANGYGKEEPIITVKEVCFNGVEKCGHTERDLGITWAGKGAGGISTEGKTDEVDGNWFAGRKLNTRTCGGDCSHETFCFPRVFEPYKWQVVCADEDKRKNGKWFECCKTAFKPYDWAIVTFLIIAKHHLKDEIVVSSDGEDEHWFDGKLLCQQELGYGLDYELKKELVKI